MYGFEISTLRALIAGMVAHDFNKVGNYEIIHVYLDLLGSWNCDTIHKYTHSRRQRYTHQHIYGLHRPTLASELAILIRTDRAPIVAQNTPSRPSYQGASHHSNPQSTA